MVDGHLNFDTKINEKGFNSGLKGFGKGLDGLKSKILGVGAAIGLAFSGKEMIEAAASMKAAESQFEQTFGVLQDSAREAIEKVASESGILEERLNGTATSIYAFAKTTGMESTQALDMMSEALQVAADSAAYYDRSLEDTSETLKSYLKGNYANDAALGLSSTEYTRNAKAMEMYGKKFTELSEAQKQLTLLQMVKDANALSGAEGQAAREAEGWENVIGNLKQAWKNFLAAIGTPILSAAVTVVKRMTAAFTRLTEVAKVASEAIMNVFNLTDSTASSTASVASDAEDAASSYEDMASAAEDAQKANDKSLASFDQINKLGGDEDTSSSDTAETPLADKELAISADTTKAEKAMSEFEKKIRKIFDKLKGYAEQFKSYYDQNFSGIFEGILSKLGEEGLEFNDTLSGIFSDMGTLAQPFEDYLTNDFTPYLQQVMTTCGNIVTGLFDTFNMVFSDIWDVAVFPILENFITDGLPMITQFSTECWITLDTLFADIKELFDTFWTLFAVPILSELTTIWTDTVTILHQKWEEYGVPIFTAFREALDNTKENILQFWNKWVKPVFDYAMKKADEIWKKHLAPLLDNILGLIGDLIKGALDIYNNVISPIISWLIDKLQPIFTKVMKFIIDEVSGKIKAIIDVLKEIITFLRGLFTGDLNKVWEGIKQIFKPVENFFRERFAKAYAFIVAVFTPLKQWASARWADITSTFSGVADWFNTKFTAAYGKISDAFKNLKAWAEEKWANIKAPFLKVAEWFGEHFTKAKTELQKPFEKIHEWFENKFGAAWSAIKNAFSLDNIYSFFRGVKDAIDGIFEGVVEGIKSPFNSAIQGINWVIDQLNSMTVTIPFVGGETTWSWSIPRLPYLAQGMAIPANYGEFMAVLGDNKREPEVVSPVSTMEAAMRKVLSEFGGLGGGDITLVAEIDGEVVYRKVVERNKQHVDATGQNEFIY